MILLFFIMTFCKNSRYDYHTNLENFYSDKVTVVTPLGPNFKHICRKCDDLLSRWLWKNLLHTVVSERQGEKKSEK